MYRRLQLVVVRVQFFRGVCAAVWRRYSDVHGQGEGVIYVIYMLAIPATVDGG